MEAEKGQAGKGVFREATPPDEVAARLQEKPPQKVAREDNAKEAVQGAAVPLEGRMLKNKSAVPVLRSRVGIGSRKERADGKLKPLSRTP